MGVGNKYIFLLKALTHKGFSSPGNGCRSENRSKLDWTIEYLQFTFVLSNKKPYKVC